MLQIIPNAYQCPDDTYFNTKDAQPELEQGEQDNPVLKLVNGQGTRRSSWGAPGVTSTVVLNVDDLVAIHIGFYHKHGGGQFWRYYRWNGEEWQEARWPKLSDLERERVSIAYGDRAPSFAKSPGKLRTSYAKPSVNTRTTYKIVELVDDTRLFSVFDGKTEYVIGKRMVERAVAEHGGGYYSYPSIEGVEQRFNTRKLFPERCYGDPMKLALIECEISGTILEYENGKLASTYLKLVRIVKQFDYTPALKEAC